ncbi:MAG: hypothetical protein ACJ79E_14395 [Anaeromyxobacteraceae bacterium]
MTAAAEKIESHLEQLPEGTLRRRVLECARQFKSSWVELGRMLSEVKRDALWREWGFKSFDAYCGKELFIRKATAEKLTMSYGFIERHEPAVARGGREAEARAAPSFEVIEVLSRAEAAGRLPEDGWREMRDDIFERPPTPSALSRQLSERYGPEPRPEPPAEGERLVRLAAAARRLAASCASEEGVPSAVAERAKALAEDLQELVRG